MIMMKKTFSKNNYDDNDADDYDENKTKYIKNGDDDDDDDDGDYQREGEQHRPALSRRNDMRN